MGSNLGVVVNALAQQELMEAPPPRRLQVGLGHDEWWGVDASTRGISIAVAGGSPGVVTRMVPRELVNGQLLAFIYREAREVTLELVARGHRPGLVMVEQPSGAQPNPVLSYAVGVVQAAIYDALLVSTGRPVRIETCSSSWWKKRACGNGGIRKPKRRDDGEYGVLVWARLNGYEGSSWDEADAMAIAEAARREVAFEAR